MDWLGKPWSELPADLGGLILRLLPCHIDRLRFRSVCRHWRLAERQRRRHLPPALPLIWVGRHNFLSPAGGELRRFRTDDVGVLRRTSPSCHGSFDGWLLYQRYGADTNSKCFLVNPLSGATVEMPLRLDDGTTIGRFPMDKIIACSPDLVAAILWGSSVAFYRPGAPSWSACPSNCGRGSYVDIARHRGKLHALNNEGELFVHEVSAGAGGVPKASHIVEHAITPPQPPPEMANSGGPLILTRRYLVVSCAGKLLMVEWTVIHPYSRSTTTSSSNDAADRVVLKIFEADLEGGRWTEANSLGNGEALFVGRGCSKAVRLTGSDPRFRENCVYVLGLDFFGYCYEVTPSYGCYDLGSGTVSQVVLDRMHSVSPVLRMEWFFPQERA